MSNRDKRQYVAKDMETPEEKRARRLAKKMAKSRREKEKLGWNEEHLGYTNESNPFGDSNLFDPLIWHKKLEQEGNSGLDERDIKQIQKRKMLENTEELEKVKKRRQEREREREQREKEQEMMQREKEAAYYREWEKQEDTFHLQQAKLRSKIRINDGTAKPIDLLAHYISSEDDDMIAEVTEPYDFLNGLKIVDLEDLLEDIKVYLEVEQGRNVDYWKDITIVAEDELKKLRRLDPSYPEHFANGNQISSNPDVREKVEATFKNNSMPELYVLERQMREKLKGGEGVDVGHWEDMLDLLKAHVARRRLKERHQEQLKNKLYRLKREQCIETDPLFPAGVIQELQMAGASSLQAKETKDKEEEKEEEVEEPDTSTSQTEMPANDDDDADDDHAQPGDGGDGETGEDPCAREYSQGRYCPTLLRPEDLPPGVIVVDLEEDLIRLKFARKSVLTTGQAERDEEEEFMKRARAGMNDEEAQFSVEIPLKPEASIWSDKYKPRKPRFFNRVHTGFEWNKYNQTHYDVDNPPPKVVQGYKFNIFYPDLIDKSKIPQYKVVPCEDKNFATIRFTAGAPYEDIAFKIVNREWEHSYKRGFRCQFQNNILQLWFHFRRLRYRR